MEVGELSSLINNNSIGETCVICEHTKLRGIHLYTNFICTDCETDMVRTETDDPMYNFYLTQLKKVTTPEIYS